MIIPGVIISVGDRPILVSRPTLLGLGLGLGRKNIVFIVLFVNSTVHTYKTYIDEILKLQKWALRTISNSHYRAHTDPFFVKYNVLNVYDMYKLETDVFRYKYSKSSLPDGFNNFFTTRSEIHDYHTRYKDLYHLTRNARTFSDHSIRTYGPILGNSLDNNVRKSNSIKHFKNQYKTKFMCLYNSVFGAMECIVYIM